MQLETKTRRSNKVAVQERNVLMSLGCPDVPRHSMKSCFVVPLSPLKVLKQIICNSVRHQESMSQGLSNVA